ncbi:MAG: 30S ribosomal protein S7 [Lentisphaeraceae bacterium]|nr:30S ribosomal protein S7 [Lentisphaeraceae bacterium]
MRKNRATKRDVIPDARFNSELVARLINTVMISGKKATAQAIVYKAMETVDKKFPDVEPLEVFFQALDNIKPQVMVKSRRVGGATYQVPVEIIPERQAALAMRWLIQYARKRNGKPMHVTLATQLIDAYNNTGSAVKKKDDTHRMAQANKAFAHFRW